MRFGDEVCFSNPPLLFSDFRVEEGIQFLRYDEPAEQLVNYVKELGFTHIQLMPVSEFPFDGSWGYQPIGLYCKQDKAPMRRGKCPY